ncbi:hypothetical protein [Amycolatopsis sp. NPDC004625]|uniref:hypothetical protein n=1 Tax=Amycolatopsis sp. NPDC004625 TaxID=3154670 RepID=UPI0033A07190
MSDSGTVSHWNLPELTAAVKALPADRDDASVVLDELGDNLERLDDIGDARIAAMDAQGVDLQILSLAPPGTHPLEPADARALSRRANDVAAEAVRRHPTRLRAFSTLGLQLVLGHWGELVLFWTDRGDRLSGVAVHRGQRLRAFRYRPRVAGETEMTPRRAA